MTEAPESAGTLGFLSAPDLLRDLLVRKATGQLVVYKGEAVKKILLKSGFVVFAMSNLPQDRLGDVLLALGMITRDQYEESASQTLATGRKQGTILVQIGALTPKDLFRGLIAQVREITLSVLSWSEGSWRFLEELPPQEEIVSLRLPATGLIFDGLLRTVSDPRWEGVWDLRRLSLTPAAQPPLAPEELDAPDGARRLLALVGQGRTPEEMLPLAGLGVREVTALLYGLTLFGLLQARPLPATAPPLATAPTTAPTTAPATAPTAAPADEETRTLREKITALAGKIPTLTHYQVLGLGPQADGETIKRAYIALAKEYHPDRFFRPEFEKQQESVNAIFMRINEAYTTLHNPTARAEYDREALALKAPAARAAQPATDSHLAREQYAKGQALLKNGDLRSAIEALRWAVNLAPQNPRYHTFLGVALTRSRQRLHEAEEHCKTAIALDYNNAQYYVHLGLVYKAGRLPEKAKKQFEAALKLDPKLAEALKELRELEGAPAEKGLLDKFLKK